MMEPEIELDSRHQKRLKTEFEQTHCVFCGKRFCSQNPCVNVNPAKVSSIFKACKARQDSVGKKILQYEQQILEGITVFS